MQLMYKALIQSSVAGKGHLKILNNISQKLIPFTEETKKVALLGCLLLVSGLANRPLEFVCIFHSPVQHVAS